MFLRSLFVLAAMLPLLAAAQPAQLKFNVVGPGAVITCCPEPNRVGQGYLLVAQPLPGARFVQWENGSTDPERSFVVSASQIVFTAYFEEIPQIPYLVMHGLEGINPAQRSVAEFARDGSRLRLSFVLPGRHGYRVLGTTNLATTVFAPVPFALTPYDPATLTENFGEAGALSVWLDAAPDVPQAFFQIMLDNQLTLPAIYFAQASLVRPGDSVILYGDNLTGAIQAFAGVTSMTATALDSHSVRVTLPAATGVYAVTVKVNGVTALGSITIRASSDPALFPTVSSLTTMKVTSGGAFEVTGKGFTSGMQAFLDGQWVTIASVAANGNSLVVRVPAGMTGTHQLTLVRNGAVSAAISVTITASDLTFLPATTRGVRAYTWESYVPNAYSYWPATATGVRVFSWQSSVPGVYSYLPATATGVRVFTWQTNQPNAYSFLPATATGVRVYTWQTNQPGAYSYLPATIRGVRVQAP